MSSDTALHLRENGVEVLAFPLDERGRANQERVRTYFANAFLKDCAEARTMVIDLSGVPSLDSAALGPLVQKLRDVQERGGRLALCGVTSPALREIFALTRFDKVFPIHATRAEAVQALSVP